MTIPELTDAEKTAQCEARDRLVRAATFAVDTFVMDNAPLQRLVTPAAWTRLLVEAAVGYLLGEGFITENPPDEDAWHAVCAPDHLAPDVVGALAEARRLREAAMTGTAPSPAPTPPTCATSAQPPTVVTATGGPHDHR